MFLSLSFSLPSPSVNEMCVCILKSKQSLAVFVSVISEDIQIQSLGTVKCTPKIGSGSLVYSTPTYITNY